MYGSNRPIYFLRCLTNFIVFLEGLVLWTNWILAVDVSLCLVTSLTYFVLQRDQMLLLVFGVKSPVQRVSSDIHLFSSGPVVSNFISSIPNTISPFISDCIYKH